MKTETIVVEKVIYRELEDLICKTFGFEEYSIAEIEEKGNDSYILYTPSTLSEFDIEDINEMLESKEPITYRFRTVMDYLCDKELIKKMPYLIQISW